MSLIIHCLGFRNNSQSNQQALERLDDSKATGLDGLSAHCVHATAMAVVGPLTYIFNLSLRNGTIPQEWKLPE